MHEEPTQPRRLTKGVKKEQKPTATKGKGKARAQHATEEEDENDQVDFESLSDQALIKGDAVKLKGLAKDWQQIRTAIHEPSFVQLQEIAANIADTAEGEESTKVSGI